MQMSHQHAVYGVPQPHTQQSSVVQPAYKQPQAASSQQMSSSYRAPFPQVSPQMSPRSHQISPHPQMSPRSSVLTPAKPMQSQNVPNNPLSPHTHLTAGSSGQSPQPRHAQQQAHQQAAKNVANQPSSVSTLQALEQMVMPPTVGAASVLPSSNMEYPPASYRTQQQQVTNNSNKMLYCPNFKGTTWD